MFVFLFSANLIDGYCCFENNCDGSFLLSKKRLREQTNGAGNHTTHVQNRAQPQTDSVDGAMIVRQRKFKVSVKRSSSPAHKTIC